MWPTEAFLEERSLELSPATIAGYRWVLRDAERRLGSAPSGTRASSSKSTPTETSSTTATGHSASIPSVADGTLSGLTRIDILDLAKAWNFRDQNLSVLRMFLKWMGHPLASKVPRGRPPEDRRRLVWYTISELEAVVAACSTPRERLIVHLACELMLRRCEIARIRLEDFQEGHVRILGKGRHGGKPRKIPYHPYTRMLLRSWRARDAGEGSTNGVFSTTSTRSSSAGSGGHSLRDSAPTGSSLTGLRRSALDKELKRVEEALRWEGVGLSLEFHALRRTGARLFFEAGQKAGKGPLEVLNELRGLLGHEDLRTTMLYIGWEIETAGATMAFMPSLETRREALVPPAGDPEIPDPNGPGGMPVHRQRRITPPP